MTPLFMWAGGKTKLINNEYMPHMPRSFDRYHEPFFGGGAMFIWAYETNPNAEFYINDINPNIVNIYKSIRDDVDEFVKIVDRFATKYMSLSPPKRRDRSSGKVEWVDDPDGMKDAALEKKYKLPHNKYDWHKIFSEQQTRRTFFFKVRQMYQEDYSDWSRTEEAATLYFLMKTAFNGVWQLGKGHERFNTPCGLMRHDKEVYDKENVMLWHEALQNSVITSSDFSETIEQVGKGSYVFLDPPYRSASDTEKTFADYGTELSDDFQEKVLDFFHRSCDSGAYSLLSNRDWGDNFFEERNKGCKIEYFDITYTVGRKKKQEDDTHTATKATEILMIGGDK